MNEPTHGADFFDEQTIGSVSGAAAGVFFLTVAIRRVTGLNHPAIPFALSTLVSFGLAASQGRLNHFLGWLLAFINGGMLFCAVVGGNETVTNALTEKPAGQGRPHGKGPSAWFESFFR